MTNTKKSAKVEKRIPKGTKPQPPKTSVGTGNKHAYKFTTNVRGVQKKPMVEKPRQNQYTTLSTQTISFAVAAGKDTSVESLINITSVLTTLNAMIPEDSELIIDRVRYSGFVYRTALSQVSLVPVTFWQLNAENAVTITTTYDAADETLRDIADALCVDGTHDPPYVHGEMICVPRYEGATVVLEQAFALDLTTEFKAVQKHQTAYNLNKVNEVPKSHIFASMVMTNGMGTNSLKDLLQITISLKPMTSQRIL